MKTKKLLSLMLTLTLILTLAPVTVSAATAVDVGTYYDLKNECGNATGNSKLKLAANITDGNSTLMIERDLTLDLNGYNLAIGVSSGGNGIKIGNDKTLTIIDSKYDYSTSTNKLTVIGGIPNYAGINVTDGTLIIESGIIHATGGYCGAGIGGGPTLTAAILLSAAVRLWPPAATTAARA